MFMKNITEFCAEQKLQQATLAFLVHNFAPKEELNELKKIFFAFDKNGDGKLSKEEFIKGLTTIDFNLNTILINDGNIDGLIKNIDSDNNGFITFEEFLIASVNKERLLTEENLKMAFDVFDRDKNGGISHDELKYILGEFNPNVKEYLWKKMIQQIDLNKDGQISYEEFHKMMMDVIENKNKRFSMQVPNINFEDNNKINMNQDKDSNIFNMYKSSKINALPFNSQQLINSKSKSYNNDIKNFKNKHEESDDED